MQPTKVRGPRIGAGIGIAGVAVTLLATLLLAASAHAAQAPIHPGVMTFTKGAQCTSNFIFKRDGKTFIGQAAHCSGTGSADETDGCRAKSLPLGTTVRVEGAKRPGTMSYNSWLTMQRTGERGANACAYNDLALVKLSRFDARRVDPSIPVYGGPRGVGEAAAGDKVYTYGNSSLRGGATTLSPKTGRVIERTGNGWSYTVYTATPGVPGDSGSAFLNASGQALGVLSTVAIAPLAGSNGVGSIRRELDYARAHGFKDLRLLSGTAPFRPGGLG